MAGASTDLPPPRPVRVELLFDDGRSRVSRVWSAEGAVVRKEPLGPDPGRRVRHEVAVLQRLAGVDGVVQLASVQPYPGSITLVDIDGSRLSQRPLPLPVDEVVRLGGLLAAVLAGVHGRAVVHRNISPSNVMIDKQGQPVLVDFGLATTFADVRPEFTHPSQVEATLAYLAPEQTGRTGRAVDHRADLYALGALLYELATGGPPFGAGDDPLRLIHDHLTRMPVAPAAVRSAVPVELSDVIMHLLEKEPDNRYQTAEGLAYDLALLQHGRGEGRFGVAGHDFPRRLLAPNRVVGRDGEIAALDAMFAAAMAGGSRAVLVSGPNGVGKTSLINELRSIAAARDGWFVAGKFDRHRRDREFDGAWQAFDGLGRLLLAAPEDEVAPVRRRLLAAIGPQAGLLAALHPEFAALLEMPPAAGIGDPVMVEARLQAMAVELVRVVASPKRPLVFVLDDLQWAGRAALGFVDMVLADTSIDGLLLVGAFSEDDLEAGHPLQAMLARWRRSGAGPERLRLGNLAPASVAMLLSEMLRLDAPDAAELAEVIAPHTQGNPYDTVELLNSLTNQGVLVRGEHGWGWDRSVLRDSIDRTDVTELVARRADALPAPTRWLLEVMACLGGRVGLALLQAATGRPAADIEQQLGSALDDGLLIMEPGERDTIRFQHDRVQETLLQRLDPARQRSLRLRLGRQLRTAPGFAAAAAAVYLPVTDVVADPHERRDVAELLRHAADQAKLASNHALAEQCLKAAATLLDPTDAQAMIEVQTGRLWALYSLGRLEEVEQLHRSVELLCTDPLQRVDVALAQISSLTNRGQLQQALSLCLQLLADLGHPIPAREDLEREVERGLDRIYRWVDQTRAHHYDTHRPDITDPALVAAAELIKRAMAPAYTCDQQALAWLVVQAFGIWSDHGPARPLVGSMAFVAMVAVARRGDYRIGHHALQQILLTSQARGYEPDASVALYLYGVSVGPWFDPVEDNLRRLELARQRLIGSGDVQYACFTYLVMAQQLLDCAPTLDAYLTEIDAGMSLAQRTGNSLVTGVLASFRRLANALQGQGEPAGVLRAPPDFDDATPSGLGSARYTGALGAALLGDVALQAEHSQTMVAALTAFASAFYDTATARLIRALALAGQARSAETAEQLTSLLRELDAIIDWLAARAQDAPANFLHLLRLVEAERAWAAGDLPAAAYAFDGALREVTTRRRRWHRALIFERAARLYLLQNMEHAGHALLAVARREYAAWGAVAKVAQLDRAYPALRARRDAQPVADQRQTDDLGVTWSTSMTGAIDLFGILSASQALSSATSIEGLRARVVQVLSQMTGASVVHLLVWDTDEQTWLLSTPDGDMVPVARAGRAGLVPLSVIRYAERTRQPLLISDATKDDRFARDPYIIHLESCSMLAVPILKGGTPQALLILENRLLRAAFSTDRIDAVMLIAGQLAVSLDNARVYASLERKVAQRTAELAQANQRLEALSGTDALTGLANRRRLEHVLDTQWRRAENTHTPLSLAMVDIDHFKLYNDHYGHPAGDECLQRIAAQLRHHIRQQDLVARYGGEEFAIVMPDTTIHDAHTAAERLRTAVAHLAQPHQLVTNQIVTVSIGVATTFPTGTGTPTDLVEAADIELYNAKRGGRNRVHTTGPPPGDAEGS